MSTIICPNCGYGTWNTVESVLLRRTSELRSDSRTGREIYGDATSTTEIEGWTCSKCGQTADDKICAQLDQLQMEIEDWDVSGF